MKCEIEDAHASKQGEKPLSQNYTHWYLSITVACLDVTTEFAPHNKAMKKMSLFFKNLIKKEIGITGIITSIVPNYSYTMGVGSYGKSWSCRVEVSLSDNSEEDISYMVWWVKTCTGREFDL